jgi:predicted alpha/beta superfamily hydrolase
MTPAIRAAALCALSLLAGCSALRFDDRYALNSTHVIDYSAPDTSRQYKLYVSLPRNYESRAAERFPVIYLLDADYSFAITRNLLRHFTDRGEARESIIVGIAYPGAEDDVDIYHRTRTRDYTPSFTLENGYGPEIQKLSGGGPAFLKVLADDILPEIDRRFRTDPAERMLVGNSFGGVFATYTLLSRPELFHNYLIVSPSLWYDSKMIFGVAQNFMATHRSLPAHVFYAVGSEENQPPPHGSMMVDDLKSFAALMKAADLSGYEATITVFDGETHNSVFPAALSRGLRVLYGFKGEESPR